MKKFFFMKHPNMHHPFGHRHFPHMPFHHKPVYPFMPPGPSHLNFFIKDIKNQTPNVGGGDNVKPDQITEINSMIVKINFIYDKEMLKRMKKLFMEYHNKWMKGLGGILGGYKGMMPHFKKSYKNRNFKKFKRFPKLMNRMVRLHQMMARHMALKKMMEDAQTNEQRVQLLSKKLELMRNKFMFLQKKFEMVENPKDETMSRKVLLF
jgi:hypothetical protein